MSSGHTRSLYVYCGEGIYQAQFPYLMTTRKLCQFANEDQTKVDLKKTLVAVTGGLKRNDQWLYLSGRWSTLTGQEAKHLLDVGRKDGTVREIRGISRIAGNSRGPGSEEAVLIGLDKSTEARKLAKALGVDYEVTVSVGSRGNEVDVRTGPSVMMSMTAVRTLNGELTFPKRERSKPVYSKSDEAFPTYQELLAHFDRFRELPPRPEQNRGDSQMREQIVGLPSQQRAQQQTRSSWGSRNNVDEDMY